MSTTYSRKQVAKLIGVSPLSIYRWESRGISPVQPQRLIRTGQLIYTEDDVEKLKAWMHKTEAAVIGRRNEDSFG